MVAPRRFLPSINLLAAFEAVARHGSVTAAANELSLTQGAVSRQLQSLENQMGVVLFDRERKRVRLTAAGASYAEEVRAALKQIASASLRLRVNPEGGALNLAILPTFGTRWLTPRLSQFLAQNTGVTVNLSTRLVPFDFAAEGIDAAIHFGTADWPGADHLKLMDEEVLPACAPALLDGHGIDRPADLLGLTLLHLATRPNAWEQWMAEQGVDYPPRAGMLFDQFATMSQAAVHGVGVALLPNFLIEGELREGLLVPAYGAPTASLGSYFLAWPSERSDHAPLVRFRAWLTRELESA